MAQINERLPEDWKEARLVLSNFMRFMGAEYDVASTKNFAGIIQFTTNGGAEVTVPHGLNGVPSGYIVVGQNGLANLYLSSASDRDNFYFKSDVVGVTINIVAF